MSENKQPLFAEERKQKILEIIGQKEKVSVPELSNIFNVSSVTIRNDLRELESASLIRRTHGGAMANIKSGLEIDLTERQVYNHDEKAAIAKRALGLIEDGDTIILDTGTTNYELARLLYQKNNITVVTNDIRIATIIEGFSSITIFLIGGILRKTFHCTYGCADGGMISELSIDKAFMGTNSLSPSKGASTPDINQAQMKKYMLSVADKVILLCDSSKIGKNSFIQFIPIDQIDTIITDDKLTDDFKERFEAKGVQVIVA